MRILERKESELQNELLYYRGLVGELATAIREKEEGYYTINKSEFHRRSDIF